jgi:hypothetical protein
MNPTDYRSLVSPVLTFDIHQAAPAIARVSHGTVSFKRPNDCTYSGLVLRPDNYKNPHLNKLGRILQKLHEKNNHFFGRFKFTPGIFSGNLHYPGVGHAITFENPTTRITLMACDNAEGGAPELRYSRSADGWHPNILLDDFIEGVTCSSIELKRAPCLPGSLCRQLY